MEVFAARCIDEGELVGELAATSYLLACRRQRRIAIDVCDSGSDPEP